MTDTCFRRPEIAPSGALKKEFAARYRLEGSGHRRIRLLSATEIRQIRRHVIVNAVDALLAPVSGAHLPRSSAINFRRPPDRTTKEAVIVLSAHQPESVL